jgi:transcriptional regulator with XRE-family HTH domain
MTNCVKKHGNIDGVKGICVYKCRIIKNIKINIRVGVGMNSYTNLIARLRKEKGISQKSLSEQVGVNLATIGKWENNLVRPAPQKIKKLAKILEVDKEVIEESIPACTYTGCDKKEHQYGLCSFHYNKRYRDLVRPLITDEMKAAPTMGDRLRLLREYRGMNPDICALQFGVTIETIAAWEKNYIKPTLYMQLDLAHYYSVGTRFLERGIIDE